MSFAIARSQVCTCSYSSQQEGVSLPARTGRLRVSANAGRRPLRVVGFKFLKDLGLQKPAWLPNFGSSKKDMGGENSTLLKWARSVKMGTKLAPTEAPAGQQIATFAGGCFWGLELAYQRAVGVTTTSVGYTAGQVPSPTYEQVCSGRSGHAEAVQVYYDANETTFDALLECFFEHVDPTQLNQQGSDVGTQYRSTIYYHTPEQKAAAERAIEEANKQLAAGTFRRVAGKKVVTSVEPATDYYLAESYHQQYLARGGRFGLPQSAEKGATERIRCYG